MIEAKDLQAKSDQMNAVDFVKPMVFKINKVGYFPNQPQPILIHFEGFNGRPYKPCKSMLRGLAKVWGMDETQWVGGILELYCDPSVKWAGKEAGGIRISGVSRISDPFVFPVQLNRSQRIMHTFNALSNNLSTNKQFISTHYIQDIEEAKNNDDLDRIVSSVKTQFGDDALNQIKNNVVKKRKEFN